MVRNSFTKIVHSQAALRREWEGHEFLSRYFSKVPSILAIRDTYPLPELDIARVDGGGTQIVSDALRQGRTVDVRELFTEYASVSNTHGTLRTAGGGTQLFYLNRRPMLMSKRFRASYQEYLNLGTFRVGDIKISSRQALLDELVEHIGTFSRGYCVPSQGDLHERNIATNHYLLDFEGSGWNLLAGDIATTVWHTLFAGSYFGPKYAKWVTPEDTRYFREQPLQLQSTDNAIYLRLTANRQHLLRDYIETYVRRLDTIPADADICAGIAFRLLTVFPVTGMDAADRAASFSLANFFMNPRLSLAEKLARLEENLQGLWPAPHSQPQQTAQLLAAPRP